MNSDLLPATCDAVVVGAGIVGAACADALAGAGLSVVVVERRSVAGGTTAAGEGNLLVSDKPPGPELDLALDSLRRWHELGADLGADAMELDAKGGIVVATTPDGLDALRGVAAAQRDAGVRADDLDAPALAEAEPALSADVAGGVAYPQDCQVQPVLASTALLGRARRRGTRVVIGATVTAVDVVGDRVRGVRTDAGTVSTAVVVNAAGVWSADLAALAGAHVPVVPRRGHILVTEPLPPLVHHKVYDSDYVGTVASAGGAGDSDYVGTVASAGGAGDSGEADAGAAQVSTVVEGTRGGTILIGSSRELVGFDRRLDLRLIATLARRAVALFPVLGGVDALRAYLGFRPYSPDHLPIIGPDPGVSGLVHATGHEGAGIGLAPATGALVAAAVTGTRPTVDPGPFDPGRPALAAGARVAARLGGA